jgi:phage terminase small subunit
MNNNFTSKEIKFIEQMVQYCGKKTATQCAIDSGFGVRGARTRASELMAKPEIRNEIEFKLGEIREKYSIDKNKHFQELGELRDMAKETKNVNAAVRAEELRGKVAGFYIDKQIIASAGMVTLPDGTKKAPDELTEQDIEKQLQGMVDRHNLITSHKSKKDRGGY